MAVYTEIFETEKIYIEKKYSLKIKNISKIKNGILNSNFLIETEDSKKYILRIFEANRSISEEEQELKFLCKISNFIPVALPILNKENKYISQINNKKISLFTYIDGEILSETTENYLKQIGEYLGKLHHYSKTIKKENFDRKTRIDFNYYFKKLKEYQNKFIDMPVLPHENLRVSKRTGLLKDSKKNLMEIAAEMSKFNFDTLPSGIIHSDIFQDNIIVKDNKIKAILDFNEAHYAPFIYDIALVLSFWIKDKNFSNDVEKELEEAFISSYSKYRNIEKEELKFLKIACKKTVLLFILLRFYKEKIEKNYFKNIDIEKKSYKDLLFLIDQF